MNKKSHFSFPWGIIDLILYFWNVSITTIDFMRDSVDLTITGIQKDGIQIPVFVNGNLA